MLSLLAGGPKYGYQIIQHARTISDGHIQWSNSKLYPLLHQMEHDDLVEAFWKASESGPKRKYYKLTPKGHKALAQAQQEWRTVSSIFSRLWDPPLSYT